MLHLYQIVFLNLLSDDELLCMGCLVISRLLCVNKIIYASARNWPEV